LSGLSPAYLKLALISPESTLHPCIRPSLALTGGSFIKIIIFRVDSTKMPVVCMPERSSALYGFEHYVGELHEGFGGRALGL
jgi:hypothetical protein